MPDTNTTPRTELYLIRHGETDWNAQRRLQGHGGEGLNDRGRQQAESVTRHLDGVTFAALYTSDLLRAVETAQIIGDKLDLEPRSDARLRERDLGE